MASGLDDPVLDPAVALEAASALETQGRPVQAIELLTAANRRTRDARVERRLVELRLGAFASLDRNAPSRIPAPITAEPRGGQMHEYAAGELTAATLRSGLASDGCVLVRGLIPGARAVALARGIDRVLEAFDAHAEGAVAASPSPWYAPFEPPPGFRVGGRRNWVRASGAVWTVESPRMLFELCALLDDTGIGDLVTRHLGERPALSANKCTLRRVPVDTNTNWHQDGAFLGADVRTVNLWLVLSDVGADSPGLEIVPRRLDTVLPTGTDGAIFDWSVSPQLVETVAHDAPVMCPEFRAGDALLFDHMLLHRTAVTPTMTRERYAMETWMFAPSMYPEGQIPLVY
jgi:Phytanoyl-CoA dioxygenase (PhyH)